MDPTFREERGYDVVVVAQPGQWLPSSVKYGTLQATLELAKQLRRVGRKVLLVGLSDRGHGEMDKVPFLGASDRRRLGRLVRSLQPINTLVGISRADILYMASARRYLVYHHGPHPPAGGMPIRALNYADVPVVCASNYSRSAQIAYGMRDELVHVVHNGFDSSTFRPQPSSRRHRHALVFAGHVVHYKGIDIAFRAFGIVSTRYPDAVFDVYGRTTGSWHNVRCHLLSPDWLDPDGYPRWQTIEQDLSGVRYHGEVSPLQLAQAFRQHSLLVMPSRVPETFGIACLDAQACGCIPVLPRQGGFPETVREGITGYLYDENTPEGLATVIMELWNQHLPSDSQRVTAQRWARETFSWEKSGAALLTIIESAPTQKSSQAIAYRLLWRSAQVKRAFCRPLRVARRVCHTVSGKPLRSWPGLLRDLWTQRRVRRKRDNGNWD